jgi:hypothetical protein
LRHSDGSLTIRSKPLGTSRHAWIVFDVSIAWSPA